MDLDLNSRSSINEDKILKEIIRQPTDYIILIKYSPILILGEEEAVIKFEHPVYSVVVILSTPRYGINAKVRSGIVIHFDNKKEFSINIQNWQKAPYCAVHTTKRTKHHCYSWYQSGEKICICNRTKDLTLIAFVVPYEIQKQQFNYLTIHSVQYF